MRLMRWCPKNPQVVFARPSDAIQKNKLKKTKEVHYNKETRTITNIPSLFFNTINRSFTLRSIEKRVSTLKSMTPKRVSNKNK